MSDTIIRSKSIVMVPIDQIKLNPKNRNKHPREQIDRLVEIIRYQGFRRPVSISNQTGFLSCGEGRYLAAKELGLKEIPAIMQDYDSQDQEYADGVADNAIDKWAELDFAGINEDMADLGPDLDIEMLGIKDFGLDPGEVDLPDLSSSEPGFQQVTFVLSNEQKDILDEALAKAKKEEDCSDELNQNKNGNVLIAALKRYVHG